MADKPPPRPPPPAKTEQAPPPGEQAANEEAVCRLTYKVKSSHDEAYLYLDQALSCDECRQVDQAMTLYNKAVRCINQSLAAYDQLTMAVATSQGSEKQRVDSGVEEMVDKMRRTVSQVHQRVEELLLSQGAITEIPPDEAPPSYDQATNSSAASSPSSDALANAVRLFHIPDGVQVFYIAADGYVSAPSYPSSLAVYQFTASQPATLPRMEGTEPVSPAQAFLQVGDWIYPLIPGRSPALQANSGAYIFPDVRSTDPGEELFTTVEGYVTVELGRSVGLMVPDSVDIVERAKLEKLLRSLTDLRQQQESPRTSEQIAKGLSTAADWISWGLTRGAEKTKGLVEYGSTALRQRIEPGKDKARVSAHAQTGAQYTRRATETAVRVSSYLVNKLGEATVALGQTLAPHIRRHSENILPASITRRDSASGRSTLDGVTEVTASGLRGFGTIYMALERSAVILARSLADETVQVVQHRFGEEAGCFTEQVVYSAGNVAIATHNLSNLGPKAVAKRAAKDAGRAVVDDSFTPSSTRQP